MRGKLYFLEVFFTKRPSPVNPIYPIQSIEFLKAKCHFHHNCRVRWDHCSVATIHPLQCCGSLHPRSGLQAVVSTPGCCSVLQSSVSPADICTTPPSPAQSSPATRRQKSRQTQGLRIELQPNHRQTEKAPTRAFSWLKEPTSAFTSNKTLLWHYTGWV